MSRYLLKRHPRISSRGRGLKIVWWFVAALFAAMVALLGVTGAGRDDYLGLLRAAVVVVGLLGLFSWIARDARKARTLARQERHEVKPGPDGDMSDVVGVPRNLPWMG
jgi:hypothetical protein